MILIDPIKELYIKSPEEVKSIPEIDFFSLQEISQNNPLVFKFPDHIKSNKEKKVYKNGFLYEFYCYLFFYVKENKWTKDKIFKFVTSNYNILIEKRQFQKDVKAFKENKEYYVFNQDK